MEQLKSVRDLQRGDIVRNKVGRGDAYVVDCVVHEQDGGARATAVQSIEVTNPSEWLVLRRGMGDYESAVAAATEALAQRDEARREVDRLRDDLADRPDYPAVEIATLRLDCAAKFKEIERLNQQVRGIKLLGGLLAKERKRAEKAEAERDKARDDAVRFCRARERAREGHREAADIAELRLAEILRLRSRAERATKPPPGIMPDYVWREDRCLQLIDCIARHYPSKFAAQDLEWASELSRHLAWLADRTEQKTTSEKPPREDGEFLRILGESMRAAGFDGVEVGWGVESSTAPDKQDFATIFAVRYGDRFRVQSNCHRGETEGLVRLRAEALAREMSK